MVLFVLIMEIDAVTSVVCGVENVGKEVRVEIPWERGWVMLTAQLYFAQTSHLKERERI